MWESLILERMQDWQYLGYVVLFIGMVVEGEIVLLAAIFLTQTGHMQLSSVLLVAFVGMLIGDILWYWFGHFLDRFLLTRRIARGLMPAIDRQLRERPTLSIFIAKFVYLLHRIVLIRVRPAGVTFDRFIKADLVAISAWVAVSTVLGVLFAASFSLLKSYVRYAEVALLLAVLILITVEHFFSAFYKKRLAQKDLRPLPHENS
ncbi:MAG TPA: VTT domain-containing protein [Candidatus Paceibacterota bacterium]